ncbi:MAG: hypothetical protein LH679_08995, partial [Cyanobacteria bacterium CAN_BIN43]|nr:hypothetical protein [Cyanobacteria bacterium CAN_BIN43]
RKPKPKTLDEFINEGGSAPIVEVAIAPAVPALPSTAEQPVKLRVPADLLAQVDTAVKSRRPSPSRHQWILEAIYEKLERKEERSTEA